MMESSELSRSQSQRRPARRFLGSIQAQVQIALGFVLLLTLTIVGVGYFSLRGVQIRATETLENATQIRELSLEIENEFFLARQREADFLNQWRTLGFETASERYVTANQERIAQAQDKLDELERVAQASDAVIFEGLLENTEELRPLLEDYQQTFQEMVDDIAERSQPGGLEIALRQQLNSLEEVSKSLDDPDFLELILRIEINEYAYLNTKQVEYADQIQILANQYRDLARASGPLIQGVPVSMLIEQIDIHLGTFDAVVALDGQIENKTTIFRELTGEIRGFTGQLVVIGENGLLQSRAQLAQANRRSLWILALAGGIALVLGLGSTVYITRRINRPVDRMSEAAQRLGQGELDQTVALTGITELDALAEAFNAMGTRLRSLVGSLERQVSERTADLDRRASQLRAAIEVGRAVATIRNLDELLSQVSHLISQQFGFYHVGIFLVDDRGQYAVLQAANSSGGQEMLAAGHRLAVGEQGIVGYVTSEQEARIALDVGEDAVHFENPYLPETRSEMALPLIVGGRLLGALDVQSKEAEAFGPADIEVLRGLADQVAIAIENARLFTETQAAIEAEQRAYGELSRQAWRELLRARSGWGYRYAQQAIVAAEGDWDVDMRKAAQTGQTIQGASPTGDNGEEVSTLAIPIQQRGQVVGVLSFRKDEPGETWSSEEITVLEDLVEQLGVALESARLYEDTQRRAARERVTGEIAARMRETLDMESVLETAVREISDALGLAALDVRLDVENDA